MDISAMFSPSQRGSRLAKALLRHEGTQRALSVFREGCHLLDDYHYWYLLSTLWVLHHEGSDIRHWKRLFGSKRAGRADGIMKPSELEAYLALPENLVVYRGCGPDDFGWISYTLNPAIATLFAARKIRGHVRAYVVPKSEVIALFTRRGEEELIIINEPKDRIQ